MIRKIVRKLGFDVVRYPQKPRKVQIGSILRTNTIKLLNAHEIDVVLDVGANIGQFGKALRKEGYEGMLISFEPLSEPFAKLKDTASMYSNWSVFNFALGDNDSMLEINIAGNSMSSSILDMKPIHEQSAPESVYMGKERIQVRKLDSIFSEFSQYSNIFLKIDVQGYELKVLNGLAANLNRVKGIQTEMSLVELYDGEVTFYDYSSILLGHGFKLLNVEPGFFDPSNGQLLQLDGIWFR